MRIAIRKSDDKIYIHREQRTNAMKYIIQKITDGEDELILRYRSVTEEVDQALRFMSRPQKKLLGIKDDQKTVIDFQSILYAESVDGRSFVYTQEDVFGVEYTLSQLEQILSDVNFFRCSKSVIINIDKVSKLKSLASNRIDATMCSGEHIIISRTYASAFRKRLKGVSDSE